MMEIKTMTPEHLVPIAEIEKMCFSDPWSVPMLLPELSNPLSLWLVAEEEGQVIGYVGSQSVLDASDMMNLAVHPQYRRQQIGEKLVWELINRLKEKCVIALALEVRESNAPAIALYEKLGFALVGTRPGYYRRPKENALIMRKEIK